MSRKLSIVIPAYNEEGGIKHTVEQILLNVSSVTPVFEIIIINDGSADNTSFIIETLSQADPRVRVIHQWVNRGFGASILLGFANAKYPFLLINPADNVVKASEIREMSELIDNNDIVTGVRQGRSDYGTLRKFCSVILRLMVRVLFGLKMRDIGWVAMYRRDKLTSLRIKTEFEFTLGEILIRAKNRGYKITEVPVHYSPRTTGKHTGATARAILSILGDLIKIRLDLWFNRE